METETPRRGRPPGTPTGAGRDKRERLLEEIAAYAKANAGRSPRIRDLTAPLELSWTAVQFHLRALRDQGYVEFQDGDIGRTLRRTRKDPALARLE